jgi:hypothetical protein
MLATNPPKTDKALWAIVGMVGERSTITHHPQQRMATADIQAKAFFAGGCELEERGGYDYVTARAKTSLPDVPTSFKGVSGGGLWQVDLSMKKSTGVLEAGRYHFRGVAFWEEPQPPNEIAIRCHGPRSIFEKAWEAWDLDRG